MVDNYAADAHPHFLHLIHKHLQAIVGFVWTSVLVRDRPHRSLEWTYPEKDNRREESGTPAVSAVA